MLSSVDGARRTQLKPRSNDPITVLTFDPRGDMLAAGTKAGTIALMDVGAHRVTRTLAAHDGTVADLQFIDGGRRVISLGGFDGTVRRWSVASGRSVADPVLVRGALVGPAVLAAHGSLAIVPAAEGARTSRTASGATLATLANGGRSVTAVAAGGPTRVGALGDAAGRVRIFDLRTGAGTGSAAARRAAYQRDGARVQR